MSHVHEHEAVLAGNRAVHAIEARYYDRIHSRMFNFWEQRAVRRELRFALDCLGRSPVRALDVGCGTGNLALKLRARGHRVDGVDLSPEMLDRCRSKCPEDDRLSLHCIDADTFLQSASGYDLICFSSVLHHLPDYVATLRRAVNALTPDGVLFVMQEPLPPGEVSRTPLWPARVSRYATKVDQMLQRARGVRMPSIDYSVSDVHVDEGIAPPEVAAVLGQMDVEVLHTRRYRVESLGIAAMLNELFLKAPCDLWGMVARRRASGEDGAPAR